MKAKDNITLKSQTAFVDGVTKGLIELGAIIQPVNALMFSSTEFKLNTIVGVLNITLFHSQTFLFTVYSQFENVDKAKDKFNCNPHSGKYNFHRSMDKLSIEQVIEFALMHFECTLPKEITA